MIGHLLEDGEVRLLDALLQRALGPDRALGGDLRGAFAGDVAAHAIGDQHDERALALSGRRRMDRVLIDLSHASLIGGDRPVVAHRTSMTVLPTCTASPRLRSIGVVTRRPFT